MHTLEFGRAMQLAHQALENTTNEVVRLTQYQPIVTD